MRFVDLGRPPFWGVVMCAMVVAGCTPIKVLPVGSSHHIEHICILQNSSVQVADFLPVMQEGFQLNDITSEVVNGAMPSHCTYTASYTARRSWDIRLYLSQAQIDIQHGGKAIASVSYDIKNGQSDGLDEHASTRAKMLPVIDTLLGKPALRKHTIVSEIGSPLPTTSSSDTRPSGQANLSRKLSELKDALDARLITQQEYDIKRKALLDAL
jgi:hypothetical protein